MADNNNNQINRNIRDGFQLPNASVVADKVVDNIQPVFEVGAYPTTFVNSIDSTTASETQALYTGKGKVQFFVTALAMAGSAFGLADFQGADIQATVNGKLVNLLSYNRLVGTSGGGSATIITSLSFTNPVKIDLGTTINHVTSTNAAGSFTASATLYGYEVTLA